MADPPPNSVQVDTAAAWRRWLELNYTQRTGVWLATYKKATGKPHPSYDELFGEALCFGWVDAKPGKDEDRTTLYFAPRKAGSGWSKPNKERVERLVKEGRMTAAGLERSRRPNGTARGARSTRWSGSSCLPISSRR